MNISQIITNLIVLRSYSGMKKRLKIFFSTACARTEALKRIWSKPVPRVSLSGPKCWMHPLPAIILGTAGECKATNKFRTCKPFQNRVPTCNSQAHIPSLCCRLCFSKSFLVGSITLHFPHLYFFVCVFTCFWKACLSSVENLHFLQCNFK